MSTRERVVCSACHRTVAGYVPAGGNGSQVNAVRHKRFTVKGYPWCEGSKQPAKAEGRTNSTRS